MNLVEVSFQFTALLMWRLGNPAGTLVAFSTQLMTLAKTVLYWLCEVCSGFKYTGHNHPIHAFWALGVTNGLWIVLPALAVSALGKCLLAKLAAKTKSKKN